MENDNEIVIPQHTLEEECADEYEEQIDESGALVRKENHYVPQTQEIPLKTNYSFEDVCKVQTQFNEEGRKLVKMQARKSAWVHNIIKLNGKKFDFTGREYLMPIYDGPQKEVLLKTARQVEKSTFLANNLAVTCAVIPYFKTLYVSPSHAQTRQFSNEKLKTAMESSPLIARYLVDHKVSTQVFEKSLTNGSFIFLRSAFLSADRSRGISADLLCCDEFQDLQLNNIPVIAQCLSHSKYGYYLYTGTPKTYDNTIEVYWQNSSMNEWMVPCSGCAGATGKKWNFLDVKNIGKTGPICKYCGKPLDIRQGQWQRSKESRMLGFRIPQLMVPWIVNSPDQWEKLLHNMQVYPEGQFNNEILGLSYDSASKPITRTDVLLNCSQKARFVDPDNMSEKDPLWMAAKKMILFAGVDWGEGNDGTGKDFSGKVKIASYTVLTIGGYSSVDRFKVIYAKRYQGKEVDPEYVVNDIVRICRKLNVRMIGTDWGHGWGVNNRLFRLYGANKCAQFMYVNMQKEVRKWDPIGIKFQLLRNHVMSEIFHMFKEQKFIFPPLEHWEHFAKDMFGISMEYIEYQRQIRYVHKPSDPDDWFHSLLYCKQIANIYYGKTDS